MVLCIRQELGRGLDRGSLSGLIRKLGTVPSRGGLNEARDLHPRLCTHVSGLVLAISQRPQFLALWISPVSYWSPVGKTSPPPQPHPYKVIQKHSRSWRWCVLDFRSVWLLHLLLHASQACPVWQMETPRQSKNHCGSS